MVLNAPAKDRINNMLIMTRIGIVGAAYVLTEAELAVPITPALSS